MRKYAVFFISLVVGGGAAVGLAWLLRGAPTLVGILIFSISCGILAAGLVTGTAVYGATRKKTAQMTPTARLLSLEKNSGRDYAVTVKRIKRAYILYVFAAAAMIFLHFTALFGAILMRLQINSTIITIIFYAIMLPECVTVFLGGVPREFFAMQLSSESHPKIHKFIMDIAKTMGIKQVTHVVIVSNNETSVAIISNEIYLMLSMRNLEDSAAQLEAIVTHELAHALNPRMKRANIYFGLSILTRIQEQNSVVLGFIPRMICYPIAKKYIDEFDFYSVRENLQLELDADDYIVSAGKAQQFINAIAKLYMMKLYLNEPMIRNIYASTYAPSDYYHAINEFFLESYAAHGDKWREILANEAQAEMAECPTLKTRMKSMGIADYVIDWQGADEFYAEKENIICMYNKDATPPADAWARLHKEQYLDFQAEVETYERSGEKASGQTLTDVAIAYGNLCDGEKAMEFLDKAIEASHRNARALYLKGEAKIGAYDDSGVQLLREAVTLNYNYFEEGMADIYRYCHLRNLTEEYAQMKEWRAEQLHKFVDILPKQNDITYYTSLSEWDIDETDEIAAELNKHRALSGIYFIKKYAKKENITTYNVGVTFVAGLGQEVKENTMQQIFKYLDNFDMDESKPDINFMLVEVNPFLIKRFFKNTPNRKSFAERQA